MNNKQLSTVNRVLKEVFGSKAPNAKLTNDVIVVEVDGCYAIEECGITQESERGEYEALGYVLSYRDETYTEVHADLSFDEVVFALVQNVAQYLAEVAFGTLVCEQEVPEEKSVREVFAAPPYEPGEGFEGPLRPGKVRRNIIRGDHRF